MRILKSCHLDPTSGHMGIKKTLDRVTERFFWPGVSKDVNSLVSLFFFFFTCLFMFRYKLPGDPDLLCYSSYQNCMPIADQWPVFILTKYLTIGVYM